MGESELAFVLVTTTCFVSAVPLLFSLDFCLCSLWSSLALQICLVQALSSTVVSDELLENCMHIIPLPSMVLACVVFISYFLPSVGCLLQNTPQNQLKTPLYVLVCQIFIELTCEVSFVSWPVGIFLPVRQAAGMYYSRPPLPSPDAGRPIRLHSPGPDLILRHQLFPGSLGSPHASRSEKMCFTLWPCRKHARSRIWLPCAPERRYVTVWARQWVLKLPNPILTSWDFFLPALSTQLLNNHDVKFTVTLFISGWSLWIEKQFWPRRHLITWLLLHLLMTVYILYISIAVWLIHWCSIIVWFVIHHSYFWTELLSRCKPVSLMPLWTSLLL